jgi:hypothetical protein
VKFNLIMYCTVGSGIHDSSKTLTSLDLQATRVMQRLG